jgi:3',5'-cyclic AMP phosphodiesterase CpdA
MFEPERLASGPMDSPSQPGDCAGGPRFEATRHTFRIVHLSDLHLTQADGQSRSEPKLLAPLRGMNQAFRKIVLAPQVRHADLALVTGDITDRGDIRSWSVFLEGLVAAGVSDRTVVLPGNHDVCCLGARLPRRRRGYAERDMNRALAGLRLAMRHSRFGPGGSHRFGVYPWVTQPLPEVAIFCLNSNNLGNLSAISNAMGEVDYYQLERLGRLLWQYRETPVKIVALHHSPNIPRVETAKRRGVQALSPLATRGHQIPEGQRRALRLLCLSHKVRLIVHGHLHRAEDRRVCGVRIIGAPASTEPAATKDGKRAYGFYTYTITRAPARVAVRLETISEEDRPG